MTPYTSVNKHYIFGYIYIYTHTHIYIYISSIAIFPEDAGTRFLGKRYVFPVNRLSYHGRRYENTCNTFSRQGVYKLFLGQGLVRGPHVYKSL